MKAPFITNRNHFHSYPSDAASAIMNLKGIHNKIHVTKSCFDVPYVMLQERVKCNNEVKLVFLDGVYHHTLSCTTKTITMSLAGVTDAELVHFATTVMQSLAEHDEYILDGLVRVDVFKDNDGELVVNELESLEARTFTLNEGLANATQDFLEQYWEKKLYNFFKHFRG